MHWCKRMAVTTIFTINLSLLHCWHRYSNMGYVFWPSDYNWINMKESTILLVAIARFIVCLPMLYFWFVRFHLQYFDCCAQHTVLFRESLYYKYNYKLPTYNRMAKTSEPLLSVWSLFFSVYVVIWRNIVRIYLDTCHTIMRAQCDILFSGYI